MTLTLKGLAKGILVAAAGLWAAHYGLLYAVAFCAVLTAVAGIGEEA